MTYRHTQIGWWTGLVIGGLGLGLTVWVILARPSGQPWDVITAIISALLIALALVASQLTSIVSNDEIVADFGWGWPRRRTPFSTVTAAQRVRNSWWTGRGIRWVGRGWMYNTGGHEAIELELGPDRVFRIGTDDPDALLAAIESARRRNA